MAKIKYAEEEFFMDDYLYNNLNIIKKKAIPNNWDCIGIIFGREGSGKTTISSQIEYFLNKNFSVYHTVFTAEQFDKAIDNSKMGEAILWDEGITGANAQKHADAISIKIITKLTMIRKKKLKIIINFPYLHMMNKYFISRCLFSIYTYAKGFSKRGYAYFYHSRQTEILYNLMKTKYNYDPVQAIKKTKKSFYFRYVNFLCLDEEEYEIKKDEASKLSDEKADKWKERFLISAKYIRDETDGNISQLCKKLNITPQNIYQIM